jgi:tetratricopeptide (TPR) repeat protein
VKHLRQIEELLEDGKPLEADSALENLLELGSQNPSALKLRAHLHGAKGELDQALQTWQRVHDMDPSDLDAREALEQHLREQQETLFFADELENGDRRFIPFPYASIRATSWGLMGCCAFLVILQLMQNYGIKPTIEMVSIGFLCFVLGPWFWILYHFIKSPTSILLSEKGMEVKTRFRRYSLDWKDTSQAYLGWDARSSDDAWLCLWVVPKDSEKRGFELNLSPGESVIRARRFFLQGLQKMDRLPITKHISQVPELPNKMLKL